MKTGLLTLFIFITGVAVGWLSKTLWPPTSITNDIVSQSIIPSKKNNTITTPIEKTILQYNPASSTDKTAAQEFDIFKQEISAPIEDDNTLSPLAYFNQLLQDYRYSEAINLYQTQVQNGAPIILRLKESLNNYLSDLLSRQQFNDFSELIDLFLSVYYDDIDILLLLADFNRISGSYMEAINVYQLANTYAYSQADQQQWRLTFNNFVQSIDQFYSEQQDWFALDNFYSHIDITGLMTSLYEYRQALIQINDDNEATAITTLEDLSNDPIVGEQARASLEKLLDNSKPKTAQRSPWSQSEEVALQQQGNQYLVDLTVNRNDTVTLLIDTGASMTTLSQAAFLSLNANRNAVEIGTRMFNTANGVTKGTIYQFEQINIGSYQINDLPIAVLDFTMNKGVDGLLGMNLLGQFRFQIDQDNSRLLLEKK